VRRRRPGAARAHALAAPLAAALLALACAGARAPRPAPLPAADVRPGALLDALARAGEARRSLRAVARLALDGPGGAGRAKQILLLERPARLRVEILGLLDQRIAVLTTDGVEYRLYRAEDRSLTGGPVHDALLWEVAGLAVTPEQAVRILLGAPAPPDGARLAGGVQLADGRVRLELRAPERPETTRLEFDAAGRLAAWAWLDAEGEPLQEARFSDYRPLGDDAFPYEVELLDRTTGAEARVRFGTVELNPALDPGLFELRIGGAG
jgi:hypothetical protein